MKVETLQTFKQDVTMLFLKGQINLIILQVTNLVIVIVNQRVCLMVKYKSLKNTKRIKTKSFNIIGS
jgi:hypothetical protein